jgi:predicted transcriptional regulator
MEEAKTNAIAKVNNAHDAMIDLMIAQPTMTQAAMAKSLGYTQPWVSRIIASDAFQARLNQRREELVNPVIAQNVEERIKGLAMLSLDVIEEKLGQTRNPDLAMKAFELSTKAAGYGARDKNVAVQNNFVVHLPNKIENPQDWAAAHKPGGNVSEPIVIENGSV